MASDYELSTDPEQGQGIAVGEFTLADGTVSLILPQHWELRREDCNVARFGIPELDGGSLSVKVEVFDDPAAVAANDLLGYVTHPAFPPLPGDALDHVRDAKVAPDFEQLTVRARGTTSPSTDESVAREASRIWRKIGLRRPNLIRILEAVLSVREEDAGSEAAQDIEDIVDHLLKFTRFAEDETDADRIARTKGLKPVVLWNTLHMRLPAESRGRFVGKGGDEDYLCDHENDGRWRLRISLSTHDVGDRIFDLQWLIEENGKQAGPPPNADVIATTCERIRGLVDEVLATVEFRRMEDDEKCHGFMWRKAVRRGETLLVANIMLSVVDVHYEAPELKSLMATIEREVRNAVLFRDGPAGEPSENGAEDANAEDDPPYDPETQTAYKAQVLTLGDGAVTVYLPKDWTIFEQDFFAVQLNIPWVDGAHILVELECYEDPESIRTNDLEPRLAGQLPMQEYGPEDCDESGRIDFEKLTRRASGSALPENMPDDAALEFREAFWMWRRIGLLWPNYVRTVEVHLYIPAADAKSAPAEEVHHMLDGLVSHVTFADHETAADRVAPSITLKRVWLWDTICMRLPAEWPKAERQNDDGTGMYVYDDKQSDRWTFWVDYDLYRHSKADPALDAADAAAEVAEAMERDRTDVIEADHDPMPDRPGESIAKVVYGGIEDGERLRHVSWHKATVMGPTMIMAHFTLVVPEAIFDDQDIVALVALLERECRNAVLVDRDADKLQRPAVGNA